MYQKPEDWNSLLEALAVDLPLGLQRHLLGEAEADTEVEEAASKAHHAWMNLATAMINAVYLRTGFWDLVLDNLNTAVRAQRLAQAAARVFVAAIGPTVGLASVSDLDALQDELSRLRNHLNSITKQLDYHASPPNVLRRIK
jgi:hypothetical protein